MASSSSTKALREALTAALNGLPETTMLDDVYDSLHTASEEGDEFAWMDDMFVQASGSVLDLVLNGESRMAKALGGSAYSSMQALTDQGRAASALNLPQEAGTRVRFVANLGSVLSYQTIPDPEVTGTIVTVKTANGALTDLDGRVFVAWDDGQFIPVQAEHLRLAGPSRKHAQTVRLMVADLGDISSLFRTAGRDDELIHKSTKDLWAVSKKGDQFVINRLFNDEGKPLKS